MYNNNFNSMFNNFYDAFNSVSSTRNPLVDVIQGKENYVIEVELPGYKKEDVNLKLENHNLTIMSSEEYNKNSKKEIEDKQYLVKETKISNSFKRSFGLPKDVDEEKIDATFKNGVLKITIPKSKAVATKKIEIESK